MFAEAASRAIDAGFDILYVHGTHGALPVQMLSRHSQPPHRPLWRRFRRAAPGSGSRSSRRCVAVADGQCAVANRILDRSALRVLRASRRLTTGLRFVEHVTRLGLVDLWDVNISSLEEWGEDAGPSRFYKSNHQAPWTSEVKRIAKVPVVGVGRFTDPDEMVRVIRSGQCDIIGCARPSIADPWLPRKIDEGRIDDIAECIGCNQCIARFEYGVPIVCTQNPTALEEYRRGWHPERFAPRSSDELILVVGAGPAGLECARVLGRRGYRAHLIEADRTVGGHLRDVAALPGPCRMVSRGELPRGATPPHARTSRSCWDGRAPLRTICSTTARPRSCWRPARDGMAMAAGRPVPIPYRASTASFQAS